MLSSPPCRPFQLINDSSGIHRVNQLVANYHVIKSFLLLLILAFAFAARSTNGGREAKALKGVLISEDLGPSTVVLFLVTL